MCKEQIDTTEPNENTLFDNVLKIIQKFFIAVGIITIVEILFVGVNLAKGIKTITTNELIELDTTEKVNYITDVFHIKNTNNIGSYRVLFNHGCMTVIMNDVKDIHELCFENLAYYELTEQDYNEIVRTEEEYKEYNELVNTSFDKRDHSYSKFPESGFDGRWDSSYIYISSSYNYWETKFSDKSDNYSIFIHKADDGLCCEIRTGWELEDLDKLHSME